MMVIMYLSYIYDRLQAILGTSPGLIIIIQV